MRLADDRQKHPLNISGALGDYSKSLRRSGVIPTWFVLLDVDQVEQAAQVCPLVETHLSVASFEHPNQASDEVEAVRTVITLAVSCSVNLHGGWLVHVFSPRRKGSAGTEGGSPGRTLAVSENLTP